MAGDEKKIEKRQTNCPKRILEGTKRSDFVVESVIIVGLKALDNGEDVHITQAENYVVAYNFEKGSLINFGTKSLQYKLVFNSKK